MRLVPRGYRAGYAPARSPLDHHRGAQGNDLARRGPSFESLHGRMLWFVGAEAVYHVFGEGAGERYATAAGPIYLLDHGVKATASATLPVRGQAGDASLPDAGPNPLIEAARLLARLEAHESPVRIPPEVRPLIDAVAPGAGSPEERLAAARAADPALAHVLGALVGTSIQPTILDAPGPQNAVPGSVTLTLACIVLPGTPAEDLERVLRAALGDG